MPKVPTLESSVSGQPLPQAAGAIPAPDTGIRARVIERIGGQVQQIGEQFIQQEAADIRTQARIDEKTRAAIEKAAKDLQIQKNKTNVMGATNALMDTMRVQEDKWRRVSGKAAETLPEEELNNISKAYDSIKDNLTPAEQNLYDADNVNRMNTYLGNVTKYSREQGSIRVQTEAVSRIKNVELEAISNRDIGSLDEYKSDIDIALDSLNAGPEEKKAIRADSLSSIHEGWIDRWLAEDQPEVAKEYYFFKGGKDGITPDRWDEVETRINTGRVDKESQTKTDEIMLTEDTTTATERVNKARTIKDPEVRDNTVSRVKARNAEIKAQEAELDGRARDNMTLDWENSVGISEGQKVIDKIDKNEFIIDKGGYKSKMNGLQKARIKEQTEKVVTDPAVEQEANLKVTKGEITTAAQYITFTGGKMSQADLKKNIKFVNQEGEVGNVSDASVRSKFVEIMGVQPKEDPFLYKLAWDYVIDQVQGTGKPATANNIDDWMGDALLQGVEMVDIPDTDLVFGLFPETRPLTIAEALDSGQTFTPVITDEEKRSIATDIKAENLRRSLNNQIPISADMVEFIFLRDEGFTNAQIKSLMGAKYEFIGR